MSMENAPYDGDQPCLSPTCHRIFGIYGPILAHANLNEDTHLGLQQLFGPISTMPFEQLGLIMHKGKALDAIGSEKTYMANPSRLKLPVHMISGSLNQEFLPDGTFRTLTWLQQAMPDSSGMFSRHVIDGYAHLDCFIGKNAHVDVFPHLLKTLATYAAQRAAK